MSLTMTNLDSFVFVAVPLLGFAISMLFRLNSMSPKRLTPALVRRQLSGQDRNGSLAVSIRTERRLSASARTRAVE